jgi:TolA-binding protein
VKPAALGLALAAMLGASSSGAPFQCASDPDPSRRMEDSAPEALWILAERFREEGDVEARRTTLRHLMEQYPSSRYAQRAEQVLEEEGGTE